VRASLGLATAYYTMGRMDDAKRIVRASLDRDNENAQAIGLESIINWREGQHEHARELIDRAVGLAPKDAMLQNYLGIIAHSMQDMSVAMNALQQAVKLDPFNAEVRFNLAVLLEKEDKLDEARLNYEAAIKMGSRPDPRLEEKIYK
jgi:Flp pilus assembly protein TadD